MRTTEQLQALESACFTLNSYRKQKRKEWTIKPEDLITLEEARELMKPEGKKLEDWSEVAVFIPVSVLDRLYESLTPKSRKYFVLNEVVGGWFSSDDAEMDENGRCTNCEEAVCDEDGEFCSTPSHYNDVPSVGDYYGEIDWCARGGLLFIYSTQY